MRRFFEVLFVLSTITISFLGEAETLTGKLQKSDKPNEYGVLVRDHSGNERDIPILYPSSMNNALSTLIGKAPFLTLEGEWAEAGKVFSISKVPTIVSGNVQLNGILKLKSAGDYEINGTPVTFGRTKLVNGASFDELSRASFEDKNVTVNGYYENGRFIIQSLMHSNILTTNVMADVEGKDPLSMLGFFQNPKKFVTRMLKGKEASPSGTWFRGTLFSALRSEVKADDSVFIITASGSENDSMGAVNGHFAVGSGKVGPNGEIQGELFNVYVTNEKEIIPGNVNLVDYFGHLVSGQNNYRPTYTLLLYGLSREKIAAIRDQLDRFHPLFRSGNSKITCNTNCATLSEQAMAQEDVYGTQRNNKNGTAKFPTLGQEENLPPTLSFIKTLEYVGKTPRAEFMPGPAFLSLLNNLENLVPELGITRVDYMYGGQTPSHRRAGGPPTMSIRQNFEGQAKNGFRLGLGKAADFTRKACGLVMSKLL